MKSMPPSLEESYSYNRKVLSYIHLAAERGVYELRGLGAKRQVPTFDDLVFLTGSASRYPLEGYREKCKTKTVLGTRHAQQPIELDIPITIAGMSFGSLSANCKEAIGRAASEMGTSTTTGDGGMTPEERQSSKTLIYQCLPSRYGSDPDDVRRAEGIEVVIGQGAKPGGGGMLLGHKMSARVADMRTLPEGIDQRSACRHPDWTGPDDLAIKIGELREITDWRVPIYVKIGATRVKDDVKLVVKAGADVVVLDGMQAGTAATQQVFIEHTGIPTLPAVRLAVEALDEMNMIGKVQLIVSGGVRSGADVAKALALGADAVAIGQGVLMALGCNSTTWTKGQQQIDASQDYANLGGTSWLLPPLSHGTLPGRGHDPGRRAPAAVGSGLGCPPAEKLSTSDEPGADHAGPRLWQVQCAPSRARGSGGAYGRSGSDGEGPHSRVPTGSRERPRVASRFQFFENVSFLSLRREDCASPSTI